MTDKEIVYSRNVEKAVENIRQVLDAIQRGQRVSADRGSESFGLLGWLFGFGPHKNESILTGLQERRIKAAVEEEREACAKIAESFWLDEPGEMSNEYRIAEAIRTQSEKGD